MRKDRGWTQQQLADRLEELGFPLGSGDAGRVIVGELEKDGKRSQNVRLQEVLAIAYALEVPLPRLLAPEEEYVRVVSSVRPSTGDVYRRWLEGAWTLADEDPERFYLSGLDDMEKAGLLNEADRITLITAKRVRAIERDQKRRANDPKLYARDLGLSPAAAFHMRQKLVREGKAPPISQRPFKRPVTKER